MGNEQTQKGMKFFLRMCVFIGAVLVLFPLVFMWGARVEVVINPVLRNVSFSQATAQNEYMEYDVQGNKARPCRYLGTSALAGPRGGYMESVNITFPEAPKDGDRTRMTGVQSFGTWRIGPIEKGDSVMVQIRHRCHTLWDLSTVIGPWETAVVGDAK